MSKSQCWDCFEISKTNEFKSLSEGVKANVRIIFKVLEIDEFELFLQWMKANVMIIFEVSETNEFELLSQGTKSNVGIVFEVSKTNEFELPSQWVKVNIEIVSKVFEDKWNWGYVRDEWKSMLGLFLKFWKPMNLSCFHNEQKPVLRCFLRVMKNIVL